MSDTRARQSYNADAPYDSDRGREPTAWAGFVVFSGVMLALLGGFEAIEGLVAILKDNYYLVTRNGLVLNLDYTTWGWIHLVIGIVAVVAGLGIFTGRMWARVLGVVIAVLSALSNVAFLPAYPVWCTIVIALDVLVIYALCVHGGELRNT
jgi:hypothetical protein